MELIKQLHRELVQQANKLIGGEMIYELCQHVQEYLYAHNKPPPSPTKSFYELRLENKMNLEKMLEQEIAEKKPEENHLEQAEIDKAVEEKRKMLHEERKKEKKLEKRVFFCFILFFLLLFLKG